MLDGFLGRGFAAKCKSLIKLTKNRIEVIRRKRKATEKFLKKDIADLLANGLDVNAYGRAEGLSIELTLSSCYDFVEQCCEFVLRHLSVLQKLSGCPEECREAISSLMFAAARFSDLPELRDLRQVFQERYGDSLECYVNQEFATNLNSKSSTLEKKVHLMQDIALEFSIKWDSKAFELRMSKSSAFAQGPNPFKSYEATDYDKPLQGKDATPKAVKYEVSFERSHDYPNDGHKLQKGKEAVVSKKDENYLLSKSKRPILENGVKPLSSHDEVNVKRDKHGYSLPGRENHTSNTSDRSYWKEDSKPNPIGSSSQDKRGEQFEGGSNLHDRWGNAKRVKESQDAATARKSPAHAGFCSKNDANDPFGVNHGGLPDVDNPERKIQRDDTPRVKPFYSNAIPPPYVKPNSKLKNSMPGNNLASSHRDSNGIPKYPMAHEKPDAASTMDRIQLGLDDSEQDLQAIRHARASKQDHEQKHYIQEDATEVPALKQKSVRRKHSKSRYTHNDANNEDAEVRKSRSRRRDEPRRGLQILFEDERHKNDEEERIIDRLLIHYSKKPSIPVPQKERRKSKSRRAHQIDNSTRESLKNGSRDSPDETPEMLAHPPRSVSLPHEQSGAVKVNKVFARAASFQPDRSNEAPHVHPKLPDYDDLAARIAALRGT
ncbi:uncharacterized protein LOC113867432 [Abrus precatorius]|uniref:Uncharacterized protein LOC113867432 n=1 Tax=Abrus precatorius TaxID=3816 RepID=A0A8B8LQA4_ABRPR|nr:uncharacterized protein LOC113867432 [Abrus precatorius]